MLATGLLLQSMAIGELLIGLYAVVALMKHIASRTTFALALVSLGCIVLLLFARPDSTLKTNFATYAFLLLVVGAISLTVETRY